MEEADSIPAGGRGADNGWIFRWDSENSLDECSRTQSEEKSPFFTSRQHTLKAFEVMQSMRNNLFLCDVTLIAGQLEVPAHRMVLAACSSYFYAMFKSFQESERERIHLKEFNPTALKLLVDYMYTSEILITEENVEILLPAANLLQLTDVRDACCDFLVTQLHPTNCLGIRAFADIHGCSALLKRSAYYIERHFQEVVESEEFLALPASQVKKLTASDHLVIPSEVTVYQCILAWIIQDQENRSVHIAELLENVRLPLVDTLYLINRIYPEPMIHSNPRCQKLVIDAFSYQLIKARGDELTPDLKIVHPRRPAYFPKLLLVIGGQAPKAIRSIECFDFEEERWYKMRDLPFRRCRAGTAVLNGEIYLVGGFNGSMRLRTMDKFNPFSGAWEVCPSMVNRRSTFGVAVLNGCIYAVGGFDGTEGKYSAEYFNPDVGEWQLIAPMPSRRSSVGVGVLNGLLYAVGGYDGRTRECLSSVVCYNPDTHAWNRVTDMASCRSGAGIGILDGIMYAVGGHDGPDITKSVEAFDAKNNSWYPVANMCVARRNAGVVSLNHLLFVVGGDNGVVPLKTVEFYNPTMDMWTMLPGQMQVGRSYAGVAALDKPSKLCN